MQVKIINKGAFDLPQYATPGSAGMDIKANLEEAIDLQPLERILIPTGLYFEIPVGYEMQIRPRSGLAIKHGITLLNTPGTIDSDYRGELKIILVNLSKDVFTIQPGERVAQMILAAYTQIEWQETDVLTETERGSGGFGHTGKA